MAELPEGKLIIFWIVGSIAILFGAWIAGHVEQTLGVTDTSYAIALVISALLIMFGGLSWISVAVTVSQEEEVIIPSGKVLPRRRTTTTTTTATTTTAAKARP